MRVLITGVAGFSGSHLARHLLEAGDEVWGTRLGDESTRRLASLGVKREVRLVEADITDPVAVRGAVRDSHPHAVYHLAAAAGIEDLATLLSVNVVGTDHLLRACAELVPHPRVLLVSSASVYGRVPKEEQPIIEDRPLRPLGAYALSKAAMELLGLAYLEAAALPVLIVRPFNLLGPDMPKERVAGVAQAQLELIRRGEREPRVVLGPLGAVRDFIDVEAAARAYRRVMCAGELGVPYNVCTGRGRIVREVIQEIIDSYGIPGVELVEEGDGVLEHETDRAVGDGARLAGLRG